jgi:hypothetical protein
METILDPAVELQPKLKSLSLFCNSLNRMSSMGHADANNPFTLPQTEIACMHFTLPVAQAAKKPAESRVISAFPRTDKALN